MSYQKILLLILCLATPLILAAYLNELRIRWIGLRRYTALWQGRIKIYWAFEYLEDDFNGYASARSRNGQRQPRQEQALDILSDALERVNAEMRALDTPFWLQAYTLDMLASKPHWSPTAAYGRLRQRVRVACVRYRNRKLSKQQNVNHEIVASDLLL